MRSGRLHTADAAILTPADKGELFHRTGAMAVEMEQATVRAAAAAVGLSVLGVRAISDSADEAIELAALRFVDDRGRPRIGGADGGSATPAGVDPRAASAGSCLV